MSRNRATSNRRAGTTLLEAVVAAGLLGVVLALAAETMAAVSGLRREAQRRQAALGEATNVMERVAAWPWESLDDAGAALSGSAVEGLPEGELRVQVATPDGALGGRRIRVEVRWRLRQGQWAAPVHLSSWRYHTFSEAREPPE